MRLIERHAPRVAAAMLAAFTVTAVCPPAYAAQAGTPLQQPQDQGPAVSPAQAEALHQGEINALNDMVRRAAALAAGRSEPEPPTGTVSVSGDSATRDGVRLTFTVPTTVEAIGSFGDGVWGNPVAISGTQTFDVGVPPWAPGVHQFSVKYRYPGESNRWSDPIVSGEFRYKMPEPPTHEAFEWDPTRTRVVARTQTVAGVDAQGRPQQTTSVYGDRDQLTRVEVTTTDPATGQPLTRTTRDVAAHGPGAPTVEEWWVNGRWQPFPPIVQAMTTATNAAGHSVDTTVGTNPTGEVVAKETLEWNAARTQVLQRTQTTLDVDTQGRPQETVSVFGAQDQLVSQTVTPLAPLPSNPAPATKPPPPVVEPPPPAPVKPPAVQEPPKVETPTLAVTSTSTVQHGGFSFAHLTITANQPFVKVIVQYRQADRAFSGRSPEWSFTSPVTTATVTLEPLTLGATYEYLVRVVDGQGRTADSALQTFFLPSTSTPAVEPPPVPPAPAVALSTVPVASPTPPPAAPPATAAPTLPSAPSLPPVVEPPAVVTPPPAPTTPPAPPVTPSPTVAPAPVAEPPLPPPAVAEPPSPPPVVAPPSASTPVQPPAPLPPATPPAAAPVVKPAAFEVTETSEIVHGGFDFGYVTFAASQPFVQAIVQYHQADAVGQYEIPTTFDPPATTGKVTLEHLVLGKTYEYIVRLVDAQGRTADSAVKSFFLPATSSTQPPSTPVRKSVIPTPLAPETPELEQPPAASAAESVPESQPVAPPIPPAPSPAPPVQEPAPIIEPLPAENTGMTPAAGTPVAELSVAVTAPSVQPSVEAGAPPAVAPQPEIQPLPSEPEPVPTLSAPTVAEPPVSEPPDAVSAGSVQVAGQPPIEEPLLPETPAQPALTVGEPVAPPPPSEPPPASSTPVRKSTRPAPTASEPKVLTTTTATTNAAGHPVDTTVGKDAKGNAVFKEGLEWDVARTHVLQRSQVTYRVDSLGTQWETGYIFDAQDRLVTQWSRYEKAITLSETRFALLEKYFDPENQRPVREWLLIGYTNNHRQETNRTYTYNADGSWRREGLTVDAAGRPLIEETVIADSLGRTIEQDQVLIAVVSDLLAYRFRQRTTYSYNGPLVTAHNQYFDSRTGQLESESLTTFELLPTVEPEAVVIDTYTYQNYDHRDIYRLLGVMGSSNPWELSVPTEPALTARAKPSEIPNNPVQVPEPPTGKPMVVPAATAQEAITTAMTTTNVAGHPVDTTVGKDAQGNLVSTEILEWDAERTHVLERTETIYGVSAQNLPQRTTHTFDDQDRLTSVEIATSNAQGSLSLIEWVGYDGQGHKTTSVVNDYGPPWVEVFTRFDMATGREAFVLVTEHGPDSYIARTTTTTYDVATGKKRDVTTAEYGPHPSGARIVQRETTTTFDPSTDQPQAVTATAFQILAGDSYLTNRIAVGVTRDAEDRVIAVEAKPVTITASQVVSATGFTSLLQRPDGISTAVQGAVSFAQVPTTGQWQVQQVEATAIVRSNKEGPFQTLADVKATQSVSYTSDGKFDTAAVTSYTVNGYGAKVVRKPDGATEFYYPADPAPYVTRKADGTVQLADGGGTTRQTLPDGTIVLQHPSGLSWQIRPDGAIAVVRAPGDQTWTRPGAEIALLWQHDTFTVTTPDGVRAEFRPESFFGATTFLIEELERLQAHR